MATKEVAVLRCKKCGTPVEYTEKDVKKRVRRSLDGTVSKARVIVCSKEDCNKTITVE